MTVNSLTTALSEGYLPQKVNLKSFRGFTLAEVLITLVIIGVIAAMTIPTLINKTNNQEYVSKLKKAYSTMAQATNRIIAEEGKPRGDIGGWASTNNAIFKMYKKHLSKVKDCPKGEYGCMAQIYNFLNGGSKSYDRQYVFILPDGTEVGISATTADCSGNADGSLNYCSHMMVDVNGAKGPNIIGKDAFMFVLKENGLAPAGCDSDACNSSSNGWGCACKALREGALNYL